MFRLSTSRRMSKAVVLNHLHEGIWAGLAVVSLDERWLLTQLAFPLVGLVYAADELPENFELTRGRDEAAHYVIPDCPSRRSQTAWRLGQLGHALSLRFNDCLT
jgi:hypothetical protein